MASIAYISKSLSPAERNYDIYDKEMLAVMCVLEQWHHYLEGAKHLVQILTDHKNLEYLMTTKKLTVNKHAGPCIYPDSDINMTH